MIYTHVLNRGGESSVRSKRSREAPDPFRPPRRLGAAALDLRRRLPAVAEKSRSRKIAYPAPRFDRVL